MAYRGTPDKWHLAAHPAKTWGDLMDNTEKSQRRRAKAKAQGAVRINVELRGDLAAAWGGLVKAHGGATQALAYLVQQNGRRSTTQDDVLAWIKRHTRS